MHNVPPEVDFEFSRSPAKSESWNQPNLQCWDVCSHMTILPTTTGEMNVRNESCSTFITSFCPNVISAFVKLCKLWNVRPTEISKDIVVKLQNHVRIANIRGEYCEITIPSKSSYSWRSYGHGLSCKEMCGTLMWVDKQDDTNHSTKYLLHASMTTTSKKKKWNLLDNCHMYAFKLFWNSHIWQEFDELIFLWSVNKLERSIKKWTQACDKRLNRLQTS